MALYDSENNRLLDTNDNVLLARADFSIGITQVQKIYIGTNEVQKIYLGTDLIYEKPIELPQLDAPVISLSTDNLVIEEVENAEYYDIYVDGVLEHTIDNRPVKDVVVNITESFLGYKDYFRIYDGEDDTGTLLYESIGNNPATAQQTLNFRSGYMFVKAECLNSSEFMYLDITVGTNVTLIEKDTTSRTITAKLSISGNGSVSFDADYKD